MYDNNDGTIRWDSLKSDTPPPSPLQTAVFLPLESAERDSTTTRYGLHTNVPYETDSETREPTPALDPPATDNYPLSHAPIEHMDDEYDTDDRMAHWLFDIVAQRSCIPELTVAFAPWTDRLRISVQASEENRRPSGRYREADTFPVSF